jgi:tetratricopeptide (TPR) repeat protein
VPAPVAPDPLAAARADIAAGRFADALAKSDAAPHPLTGAWLLLRADALRGLGKRRDAADALVAAAAQLDGAAQTEAAYSAAYLRFHDLKDGSGALAALAAGDVDVPGSMFEERGLALHVEILVAQGKRADARPLAQRYLERFPHGDLRSLMHQLVESR